MTNEVPRNRSNVNISDAAKSVTETTARLKHMCFTHIVYHRLGSLTI